MSNEQKSQKLQVELNSLKGKVGINLDEFHNKKVTIESIEVKHSIVNRNGVNEDNYFLEIKSSPLNDKGMCARNFISLWKDEETGEFNYSKNTGSNAFKFLTFFNIENFEEAVGKETSTIVRLNDNGTKKLEIYFGQ